MLNFSAVLVVIILSITTTLCHNNNLRGLQEVVEATPPIPAYFKLGNGSFIDSKATRDRVESLLDKFSGVVHVDNGEDEVLLDQSSGLGWFTGNDNHTAKVPQNAQFLIGSNSKLFTAVAIYQLQEGGKLNVTDKVSDLLTPEDLVLFGYCNSTEGCGPWCQPLYNATNNGTCYSPTVKDLLSMSSGIIDISNGYPEGSPLNNYSVMKGDMAVWLLYQGSTADYIKLFINNPLQFIPGTEFHYTNSNFNMATYLVEKFSNTSFYNYVDRYITKPLGLSDTGITPFRLQWSTKSFPRLVDSFNYLFENVTSDNSTVSQAEISNNSNSRNSRNVSNVTSPVFSFAKHDPFDSQRCMELNSGTVTGAGKILSFSSV